MKHWKQLLSMQGRNKEVIHLLEATRSLNA